MARMLVMAEEMDDQELLLVAINVCCQNTKKDLLWTSFFVKIYTLLSNNYKNMQNADFV